MHKTDEYILNKGHPDSGKRDFIKIDIIWLIEIYYFHISKYLNYWKQTDEDTIIGYF
jgi:hypothetical protein